MKQRCLLLLSLFLATLTGAWAQTINSVSQTGCQPAGTRTMVVNYTGVAPMPATDAYRVRILTGPGGTELASQTIPAMAPSPPNYNVNLSVAANVGDPSIGSGRVAVIEKSATGNAPWTLVTTSTPFDIYIRPNVASISAVAPVCENDPTTVTITGTGFTAYSNYTVTYLLLPSAVPHTATVNVVNATTATFVTDPLAITTVNVFLTGMTAPGINCPVSGLPEPSGAFVTVSQLPTIGPATGGPAVCEGTNATLNLTGLITAGAPQTITYNVDGGAPQTATITITAPTGTASIPTTGLAAGPHTVTITAITRTTPISCTRVLDTPITATINVNARPTVGLGDPNSAPFCQGETSNTLPITLTGAGTITFNPLIAPSGISAISSSISAAGTGTLTVTHTNTAGTKTASFTVTDGNGCTSDPATAISITLNANPTTRIANPLTNITITNPTFCAVNQGPQSVDLKGIATGGLAPYNFTWGGTAGVTGMGTGADDTKTASAIGTVTFNVVDANGCTDLSAASVNVRLLTVQPSTLTPPMTTASCTQFDPANIIGSVGTATISGGAAPTGPAYQWSRTGANDMTYVPEPGPPTGVDYDPTTLPNNMSNINEVYNYQRATSFTSANGLTTCTLSATAPVEITVHPIPRITGPKTASPSPTCSGVTFSYTPMNAYPAPGDVVPANTTYSWPAPVMPMGVSGGVMASNQTSISGAITNSTNAPVTITYIVTPNTNAPFGNCPGATFNVQVTINPTPDAAASPSPQQICSATATGLTVTNPNMVAGATFKWTAVYGAVTGGAGSAGDPVMGGVAFGANAINETLSNLTANPIVVVYTITPIGPAPTYCAGTPITVNVTVLPEPSIPVGSMGGAIKIVGPDNKSEACQGSGIVNLTNNATCAGANELVKWYTEAQKNDAPGPMSGLAADPTTISTTTPGVTKWYVACRNQVNGCETAISRRVEVIFTVNPAPARPNPITLGPLNPICEGNPTPSSPMTNNADAMCEAANGPGFTAVWYTSGDVLLGGTGAAPTHNPTTTTTWHVRCKNPVTGCISLLTGTTNRRPVTFTVNPAPAAPFVFGADAPNAQFYPKEACQGPTGSTVTLDPTDILTVPNTIPFNIGCGSLFDPQTLKWYRVGADNVTLTELPGGGASPTTLPTEAAGLQKYRVSCVRNSTGCESLTKTEITFMVNPAPAAPATITLTPMTACFDTPAGAAMTNNATCNGLTPGGESPVWYDNAGVPLAGAPAVTPAVTTTYQVRCKNTTTNCISLTYTEVTFTKFPLPTITAIVPATATYCNNAPVSALALSGTPATAIAPNSAVKFKYSGGASIGLMDGTTSTALPAFTATNAGTVVVNVPITITPYTYGPNGVDNGGTGDDCLGAPFTYTITVIPTPTVTFTCPAPVCANDAFSAIAFSSPVAGTVFNWTNDNTSIGLGASGMGNIASFTGLNASTTLSNIGVLSVTPSVTVNSVTCTGPVVTCNLIVKPRPSSNLTASQTDVCPNTEVTLNPNCSIPTPISTVQWGNGAGSALPAPAGPTVTPTAPDLTYIYTAICVADGCAGNMSDDTVRTHRLLVDIVKVAHPGGDVNQPGAIMEVRNDLGKDLSVPKNTIVSNDGSTPRTWNILARPCYAPVGSISFEFLGGPLPLSYKTVDNFAPHAFFANDGASAFYSQASMTYGPGSMLPFYTGGTPNFPNGIYTVLVQGRTNAVPGAIPAARNKLSGGALLSTRTVTFEVKGTNSGARIGVEEEVVDAENWLSLVQNPISEEIMVRISGNVGDNIQLNLSNLQGQEVHKSNLQLETTSQLNKINARDFSTGFYILKAVNGDKVKTIKVLKVQ